jgi:hypothetical protein
VSRCPRRPQGGVDPRSGLSRLRDSGVKPLLLPARSPNLNAFAEWFVLSVKSECLDRIVPLGEAHLRAAVGACVDHYHQERPHQGLDNELITLKTTSIGTGPVQCCSAACSKSIIGGRVNPIGRVFAHDGKTGPGRCGLMVVRIHRAHRCSSECRPVQPVNRML